MRGTFTIPSATGAHKVRVSSERRYVVLRWSTAPMPSGTAGHRYVIDYRSDDLGRAKRRAWADGSTVLDTETGEIV